MADNGGEYQSNEFKQYLEANGINHYETCADAAAQNGLAEAYGKQLQEMAFSLPTTSCTPRTNLLAIRNTNICLYH